MTLVSGTAWLVEKFARGHPQKWCQMRVGWVFSTIFNQYVVISRKRCILDTKLLWGGNRKPYVGYRMVSLSMTENAVLDFAVWGLAWQCVAMFGMFDCEAVSSPLVLSTCVDSKLTVLLKSCSRLAFIMWLTGGCFVLWRTSWLVSSCKEDSYNMSKVPLVKCIKPPVVLHNLVPYTVFQKNQAPQTLLLN